MKPENAGAAGPRAPETLRASQVLIVLLVLLFCWPAAAAERVDGGRMGTVRLFAPAGTPHALVYLFSDAGGWTPALDQAAEALTGLGAAVAGVDLGQYLALLTASDDGCHYVISEIEDLSHRLQRQLGMEAYHGPILAGIGAGGTLAYAALAQSPAATVDGAVSVAPAHSLATKVPLCAGAPNVEEAGGGFRYQAPAHLPGFWRVATDDAEIAALAGAIPHAQRVPLEPGRTQAAMVVDQLRPVLETIARVDALPLVELPAAHPGRLMAVIYSGDGGWRDLDKEIGEALQRQGIPVVGVDSLRYFWHGKTPEEVAQQLAGIIDRYGADWGTDRVILIGYSFGADILPFAVNRLPAEARARVAQISLLGFAKEADFEISVTGWITGPSSAALPVLPEAARLDLAQVQCFSGEEEDDTACTAPELSRAQVIKTGGGHHFDGDYGRLAQAILEGAERRIAAVQ